MDMRVAIALVVFSLSLNLIGAWAGVGEFERDVNINQIQDDLNFEVPSYTDSNDSSTFEAVATFAGGLGETFSQGGDALSAVIGLLKLAIPTITGVAWFDLLVWMPMSFAVLLGIANWLRGK